MVKIKELKIGTLPISRDGNDASYVATLVDGGNTVQLVVSSAYEDIAPDLNKAELTELIEMLQQFAEYLEE